MIKKLLYFVLAILGVVYIFSLSASILVSDLAARGWFGQALHYLSIYGGAGIIFLFASINFTGNVFKVVLNVLLIIVTVLYIIITIIPGQVAGL